MTDAGKRIENPEVEQAEIAKYIDPQNKEALNNAVMEAISTINSLLIGRQVKGVHIDLIPVDTPPINQPTNMHAITPLGLTWCWWKGLSWCSNPDNC